MLFHRALSARPGVGADHANYKWWALSCTSLGMLLATINQNMTYRAIWQTTPPVQSKDKLVKLPLKLSLKASHTRVKKNGVVTFKGNGHPAHPGATVQLQQEDSHGGFKTFAKGTLSPGSKFSVRTRVRRGGVFRALFAGDGQYGVSASRALRVSTR